MNRLTMKISEGFYTAPNIANTDELKYKLGQLEDIEEELGVDLITLFKALKNGFYFKYKDKMINSRYCLFQIRTNLKDNWIFDIIKDNLFLLSIKLKDYGKTWVLTKEELENE